MLCPRGMFQQLSLVVFLLCSPVPLYGKPIDSLTNRMRRSVSHAQLMHDKGRSLEEFKRRLWLQGLLDKVHTADSERAPPPQSRNNADGGHITFSGSALRPPKPPGGTKNLPLSFQLGGEVGNLPQETNKSVAYKDQPLKVSTKRKKKVKGERGRRRESEKRRRRARDTTLVMTWETHRESQRTLDRPHHVAFGWR
ncbi:parathyroid hormone-related protein-like [Oncorhynchus nerka]|uniref:parathyroid hormone-related protein-like n=1 Tax=Oncorhynchus nerka TaxID=8023 RepID=UPI00113288FF|nr:parathyroid hormone-related protein-like [Oncorhynchus nerka]